MRVFCLEMLKEKSLELSDLGCLDLVQETSDTSIENTNLLLSYHRLVLLLLKEFCKFLTSVEEMLSRSIQVRTELGERSDFSVLSKLKLKRTGDLLHGLNLGG